VELVKSKDKLDVETYCESVMERTQPLCCITQRAGHSTSCSCGGSLSAYGAQYNVTWIVWISLGYERLHIMKTTWKGGLITEDWITEWKQKTS